MEHTCSAGPTNRSRPSSPPASTSAEAGDGRGHLPDFVKREFEAYLTCGILAHGLARVRCVQCQGEILVAFSCKRRGFVPRAGGGGWSDTAAHLVDQVLPHVPIRQWVLTVPVRLRYRLAFDAALTSAVLGVFLRAVFGFLRRQARAQGIAGGRGGAVTIIQRFGCRRSYCDLLHEQSLDPPPFYGSRRNGAARRSSLAAVSSAISSHHT